MTRKPIETSAANAAELKIVYMSPSDLKPDQKNVRSHTPEQIAKLRASIKEFGFTNPVLIDEAGIIICGHARTKDAIAEEIARVPVIEMRGLSNAQRQLLAIADNRIALDAGWNYELLAAELERLSTEGADISVSGFDLGEMEAFGIGFGDDLMDPDILDRDVKKDGKVKRVEVTKVADKFWISVRGPLPQQAKSLKRLQVLMEDMEGVTVELGTVAHDDLGDL